MCRPNLNTVVRLGDSGLPHSDDVECLEFPGNVDLKHVHFREIKYLKSIGNAFLIGAGVAAPIEGSID